MTSLLKQVEDLTRELDRQHTLHDNLKRKHEGTRAKLQAACETLEAAQAELERFRSERSYVIGCNDGYDALADQIEDIRAEFGENPGTALLFIARLTQRG